MDANLADKNSTTNSTSSPSISLVPGGGNFAVQAYDEPKVPAVVGEGVDEAHAQQWQDINAEVTKKLEVLGAEMEDTNSLQRQELDTRLEVLEKTLRDQGKSEEDILKVQEYVMGKFEQGRVSFFDPD